jgi:hypothetical protein
MFKRLFLILFYCFISLGLFSQPAMDTIKLSLKKKPSIYGKFGTRSSFVDNYRTEILGISLGLNYNDRIRFTMGYHTLYSSAAFFNNNIYFFNSALNVVDSSQAKLHLNYGSLQAEYVYYNINKWRFTIPILLGFGKIFYQYNGISGKERINNRFAFTYEPAVSVEYKLLWWLGLSADVGFRFVLTNYKYFNEKINSPTYAFKAFVYYGEIYKRFFSKNK